MTRRSKGKSFVVRPDGGESYWQPVPANGYAEVRVSRRNLAGNDRFSTGVQEIAPMSRVRAHAHDAHEEILFFYEGRGRVVVDGVSHEVVPGTTVYVGPLVSHEIINECEAPLRMMWTLMPGGLEDFFQAIGRPRKPGAAAPEPFARPADVARIEAETVFAPPSGD